MHRFLPDPGVLSDEVQGIATASLCLFCVCFMVWEMATIGAAGSLLVAVTLACAAIPAFLAHARVRRFSIGYARRSARVYFPFSAALLGAMAVIMPAYLATVPAGAY